MRFKIEKSENRPSHWVCSDFMHKIVCIFEDGKFNDTQEYSALEYLKNPDPQLLSKAANEMAAWLRENHYDKIF